MNKNILLNVDEELMPFHSIQAKTSVDDRPIPLRTPFPDIGSDGESSLSDIPFVRLRRVLAEESSV